MDKQNSEQQTEQDPNHVMEVLNDGVVIEIAFRNGTTQRQKISKVPIRNMAELGKAWGSESKEIQVYTNLNATQVDQLTDESWNVIMEEGRRLNFLHFNAWFRRQSDTLAAMGDKNLSAIVKEAVSKVLDSSKPLNS